MKLSKPFCQLSHFCRRQLGNSAFDFFDVHNWQSNAPV
jgi:hypothetical protein